MSAGRDTHSVADARRRLSRRQLLGHAGGLALTAAALPALPGCTGSGTPRSRGASDGDDGPVTIQWWDQFRPLTELFENELFAPYSRQHPNVKVQRRQLDAPDLAQALQLARRSNQLPDVHSIAGLQTSAAALVTTGWFQPIDEFVDLEGSPVGQYLYDGIHRFEGRVYTFPLFSGQWHDGTPWLNTALAEQAGVDPAEVALTWDAYRKVLRQLTTKTPDGVYGLLMPMQEPGYLGSRLSTFAQTAGAPGSIDWRTGEYVWASEPFFEAMEYLIALQRDGVIHPGSASMAPRDARARWAAGQGAVYMWGPWIIGGLLVAEPEAVERGIAAWRIPAPDANDRGFIHTEPASGPFWLSSQSQHPDVAADLMLQMTTDRFLTLLAGAMDQPPIQINLVEEADVHEAYRANVEFMRQDVRQAPVPQIRNPDVADVLVEMQDIHPNPGEIVQAVLTGSESNYRAALREYNDKLTAERDRAIKAARTKGAEVSIDDWVFENWDPANDYDQAKYAEL